MRTVHEIAVRDWFTTGQEGTLFTILSIKWLTMEPQALQGYT